MTTLSSMRLGAELFVQTFMPGFGKETIPLETFTQVITATTDQINSQLLEADRSDPRNKAILNMMQNDYFADRVAKTDWVDFTVTLKDGTVINIITNTQFTDKDGDTIFYQVDGNGIFQTLEDLESSLTEEEAKKILEKNTSLEFNLTTYEGVMKKMKELAKSDLFKFKQHTKDGSILVTKSDGSR
jgi:hypothetical protein